MTESDLNMLIAHAHRRIEQLQKQLAKQQVTLIILCYYICNYYFFFKTLLNLIF